MAKSARQKLTKQLDDIVRTIIRIRDDNKCQKCGKHVEGSESQISHVIPRSRCVALRWDFDNIKVFCTGCHLQWWHLNPTESGQWFAEKYPDRMKHLDKHKREIKKWRISELRELLADYKIILKGLK